MAGFARLAGFAIAAAGGYVAGRRHEEVVTALDRLRGADSVPLPPRTRGWDDETEYEHLAEQEAADRHSLAEEIKRRPLRERTRQQAGDEGGLSPTKPKRPDPELRYPRSF